MDHFFIENTVVDPVDQFQMAVFYFFTLETDSGGLTVHRVGKLFFLSSMYKGCG